MGWLLCLRRSVWVYPEAYGVVRERNSFHIRCLLLHYRLIYVESTRLEHSLSKLSSLFNMESHLKRRLTRRHSSRSKPRSRKCGFLVLRAASFHLKGLKGLHCLRRSSFLCVISTNIISDLHSQEVCGIVWLSLLSPFSFNDTDHFLFVVDIFKSREECQHTCNLVNPTKCNAWSYTENKSK